jgi:acyl-coenzyme A thioesterase PaaI-like protein
VRLSHHDLCFGCGQTNLFGLMLETQRLDDGSVAGRFFVKQDHQGPDRATAHEGVVSAALCEVMALACGSHARAIAVTVELAGSVPVGTFLDVQAIVQGHRDGIAGASATASCEGRPVAGAHGRYALGAG